MKSFERLVLAHLKNITGPLLDPLQFAYRTNRRHNCQLASSGTVMSLRTDGKWSSWSSGAGSGQNNLELNTLKTVEMTVDFRRSPPTLPPLSILNNTVSAVETFRFLGSTISQDLRWESNIDVIRKKAQQRMYFLHQLRKFNLPQELLIQFYTAIVQSVLCLHIHHCVVWISHQTGQEQTTTDSQ
ncbi:hypothetical protein L3Q82_025297 [Scortum barcoo]|uniref:Uncharacterized protein n=1 Tax=Scortum barcoo TaxID=214431 RepID=A0ACB8WRY8_9TELE|nr:hypothetical protein L3Q82_025297 [Scortum barcoo]